MSDVLALCYHAVSPSWNAALSVTPEALEGQLTTLMRRGWRGARFADAVLRPAFSQTLAVTFDDAFLSVLECAYPILSKLGLPATVFAPTAFMERRQPLSWPGIDQWSGSGQAAELECMNWDDLRALVDEGWEIGSHTRTHPRLTQVDKETARTELEESRRECEEHLGCACMTVAYPYGDVDELIARLAAAAGYVAGAALPRNVAPAGAHRWPRVGIYHDDRPWRFWLKVNGGVRRIRAMRL